MEAANDKMSFFRISVGDVDKIKHQNIFDHIPQYRYCNNIVGMAIGAFTKHQPIRFFK